MPTTRKAATGFKSLSKTMSKQRQGVLLQEILQHKASGNKLLLKIYSDSYDFQCYAHIDIYNPTDLKWNRLHSIPFALMTTPDKAIYRIPHGSDANVAEHLFVIDRQTLLLHAKMILE